MPLELPVIDGRTFEELLAQAKQRIPAHTPEWTNFEGESDPGITIVELFAFLTENLLYRAGRIPDRNRVKFLQLLGVGLKKASPARGLLVMRNERGPVEALTLNAGVMVSAGSVPFLTRDPVSVLPLESRAYFKSAVSNSEDIEAYRVRFAALAAARSAAGDGTNTGTGPDDLVFYESLPMTPPAPANPSPALDLSNTQDKAIYLALLAPPNVDPDIVRNAIVGKTLSLGIVPALTDGVDPLLPRRAVTPPPAPSARLVYEIADPTAPDGTARYTPLTALSEGDVLNTPGIVSFTLPDTAAALEPFAFKEPLQEGTGDLPPRIEDDAAAARLVTWIRVRLRVTGGGSGVTARLSYVGVNAVRIEQAIPVPAESLGTGTGEPDQAVFLANTPVLETSVRLAVGGELWRMTDDLLAAGANDCVFTLDPESGEIRFGDGLRGLRPPRGATIRAAYEYGGGPQGNVGIGAVKATTDPRLQGGFKLENPLPTYGGDRGETQAEGERQIPLVLRHRDRAVTEQDFEDIARRADGVDVGRAEALPLFHPNLAPTDAAPGVVTVFVLPAFDAKNPLWPSPDRLFLQAVCDTLDARRLLTTEVHVVGPEYVPIYLSIGVKVRGGYFRDAVFQAVQDRLKGYLSSLPPGGTERTGWPLNKRLVDRDLEAVVTRVPGVEYVEGLLMGVGSTAPTPTYNMTGLQLPRLDKIGVGEGTPAALTELFGSAPSTPDASFPVPVARARC